MENLEPVFLEAKKLLYKGPPSAFLEYLAALDDLLSGFDESMKVNTDAFFQTEEPDSTKG